MEELSLTTLPERIFFTGVPGSRWSGIAREIKSEGHYNCTDRAPHRAYKHHNKVGHTEAYYGTGMEFDVSLDRANLDAPYSSWDNSFGCKLHMSHEWVYCFREIQYAYHTCLDTAGSIDPIGKVLYGGKRQEVLVLLIQIMAGIVLKMRC